MAKNAPKNSKQVVGNIGLYYVCYELSKLGWNVLSTSRNAKGVDIIIYSQDAKKTHTIQVKALSKKDPVPLGSNLDNLFAEYLIICCNVMDKPELFVDEIDEDLKKIIHKRINNQGITSYWLQPKDYEKNFMNDLKAVIKKSCV